MTIALTRLTSEHVLKSPQYAGFFNAATRVLTLSRGGTQKCS